jgi:hypothetical protein
MQHVCSAASAGQAADCHGMLGTMLQAEPLAMLTQQRHLVRMQVSDDTMRYYSAFAVYSSVITLQCTSCTCTFGQLSLQIRLTWLAGPGCRKVTVDQLPATELLVSLCPGIRTAPDCIYKLVKKHAKYSHALQPTRITNVPLHTSMRCPANAAIGSP